MAAASITAATATPGQPESSIVITTGSTVQINAPMDKVFEIILDAKSYGKWNTWCPALEFPANEDIRQPGSVGILKCMMGTQEQKIPVKILDVSSSPDRCELQWRGQLMPWWFGVAERVHTVDKISETECRLVQWESMSGWGIYLLKYLMGVEKQLKDSNVVFANDLKAYAEERTRK